ncbi:uncharacterized protein Dana_GF27252 [Drosophila ananassae]|uniref:Uncharacterized protein n=1 Tax=Drosophila ananassae TaxID=7217 RepID=A0A0P8Y7V3_DROAN|nr:uncharacterized protein Dana_GF27252 [Drosophila ananassae]
MGVPCGRNAYDYAAQQDDNRISTAEVQSQAAKREDRIASRRRQIGSLEGEDGADDSLYGPGIDDDVS